MLKEFSFHLVRNLLDDIVKVRRGEVDTLRPLVFAYYVSMACNFRCSYCEYFQAGLTTGRGGDLGTADAKRLLAIIREACPSVYFTGGEPFMREDFLELLAEARRLGFSSISMVSNMSLIHRRMEALEYLDNLVVSLDMLDEERYAGVVGTTPAVVRRVKENIAACARLQKEKKFRMTVNYVATEQTVAEVRRVLAFCEEHGIRFTIGPEVMGDGTVEPRVRQDPRYREAIDFLLEQKGRMRAVADSRSYLRGIRDFRRFDCYPALIPRVEPNGDMFFPCKPLRSATVNLLEAGSYAEAQRRGLAATGGAPACSDRCYMNCYLAPSLLVTHPLREVRGFL